MKIVAGIIILLLVVIGIPSFGGCIGPSVKLHYATWDQSTETDVTGYYLYWRVTGGQWVSYAAVSKTSTAGGNPAPSVDLMTLGIPVPGIYEICVTARDVAQNESDISNIVTWDATVPSSLRNLNIK
jgi:hypothetical protein